MRVLFLAPQPFYQERGTPIAVKLALEALASEFKAHDLSVDLVVYDEGEDIEIPDVVIHRIPTPKFLKGVRPGISIKKLLCDVIFAWVAFSFVWKKETRPNVIHAVEESVFIALFIKWIFGVPYIYDMDSSLSLQLTERWWFLRPFLFIFELLEKIAIKNSIAVAPVCDALHALAEKHGSKATVMLRDVSLVDETIPPVNLRAEIGISSDAKILLYVGNLERYQGVELLLQSFAGIVDKTESTHVVIIGGRAEHIDNLKSLAENLNIVNRVHLIGTRPVRELGAYLDEANILVSPRIQGNNTPMKIYSYMYAGKAILATDLSTHTQVLDYQVSLLSKPVPLEFGNAILKLLNDSELCAKLGSEAKARAGLLYTPQAFRSQLIKLYEHVLGRCSPTELVAHL